MHKATILSLPK